MRTNLLLLIAALSGPLVEPCAAAEESPWVENMGWGAVDDAQTRGLLERLEEVASQQVAFSMQQDAATLTLSAARMTVKADKRRTTCEDNTEVHNMRLAIGTVKTEGYAYVFPLKEEDRVSDDFFEIVVGWAEAHVSSPSAPHVLIEFEGPDGGLIYVFFESANDGGSAKIRRIFYMSPEDLQWS